MGWKRNRLEALQDDDLHDVYLVGTDDGEEVACCKSILATQSPVFKSMFFKGFREQREDRCKLDFHSVVIGLVVKYCYCGEVDAIQTIRRHSDGGLQKTSALLVELREAGRYLELEELRADAEKQIGAHVFEKLRTDHECAGIRSCF